MNDKFSPERLFEDLTHAVAATVRDVLPVDAQEHLLAAQRELWLALTATLEHHADHGKRKQTPGQRKKSAARKRPKRVPVA